MTGNPARFAEWFNEKYFGDYRRITTEDVKELYKKFGRFGSHNEKRKAN